jgi:teichuronic acid biosynthesis protein TuaE
VKVSYVGVTNLIVFACILGAQVVGVDLGPFRLSPYRLLVLLLPLLFTGMLLDAVVREQVFVRYEYMLLLAGWVCYAIITGLWVEDSAGWVKSLVFLVIGCISTSLIFAFVSDSKKFLGAAEIVVVASIAAGLLGIHEIVTGSYLFLDDVNQISYESRSQLESLIGLRIPVSVFGNPNNYASFLLFASAFSFMLLRLRRRILQRLLMWLALLLNSFMMLATQSRSGVISLLLFFSVYVVLMAYATRGVARLQRLAVLGCGLILGYSALGQVPQEVRDFFAVDWDGATVSSDYIRLNLLRNGLSLLAGSFYAGVGVGNVERQMQSANLLYTGEITNIHNWWFEILVSSGVIVFAGYAHVYIRTARRAVRGTLASCDTSLKVIGSVVASVMVAFVIAAVGPSSLFLVEWFWPLMALVMKAPFLLAAGPNAPVPCVEDQGRTTACTY